MSYQDSERWTWIALGVAAALFVAGCSSGSSGTDDDSNQASNHAGHRPELVAKGNEGGSARDPENASSAGPATTTTTPPAVRREPVPPSASVAESIADAPSPNEDLRHVAEFALQAIRTWKESADLQRLVDIASAADVPEEVARNAIVMAGPMSAGVVLELIQDSERTSGDYLAYYITFAAPFRFRSSPELRAALPNAIRQHVDDEDPLVRMVAISALGGGDPSVEKIVVRELELGERATFSLDFVLHHVNPTKDHVAALILPYLEHDELRISLRVAERLTHHPPSRPVLWKLVRAPATSPEVSTAVLTSLSRLRAPEFVDSALIVAGDEQLDGGVRLAALRELRDFVSDYAPTKHATDEQKQAFAQLITAIHASDDSPEELRKRAGELRRSFPLTAKPIFEAEQAARERELKKKITEARTAMRDRSLSMDDRREALVVVRDFDPDANSVIVEMLEDEEETPEFRVLLMSAASRALNTGKLDDKQEARYIDVFLRLERGEDTPTALRDAVRRSRDTVRSHSKVDREASEDPERK